MMLLFCIFANGEKIRALIYDIVYIAAEWTPRRVYWTLGTMLGSVALALVLLGFDFDFGGEGQGGVGVKVVKANDDGVAKLPVMGYNSTSFLNLWVDIADG